MAHRETLTNEEKETIILFDETPADATIFTYNRAWQSHLEKVLGLKPVMDNGCGGKEYRIPKKRIRLPRWPRQVSAEQKRRLAAQLKRARQEKLLF